MNDRVHIRKAFQDFAMNASFRISFRRIRIDGLRVFDVVLDQVAFRGNGPRSYVSGHDEAVWVVGMADGEMAIGIEDTTRYESITLFDHSSRS